MSPIRSLIQDVDRRWGEPGQEKVRLSIIGSAALQLQTAYDRGTRDGDILEVRALPKGVKDRLLTLAGPGTDLSRRHRIFLEFVAPGIPFLPPSPVFHPLVGLNESLVHFELEVLDVVDAVVSKLKRFRANDVSDIRAMIDLERVEHPRLIERFRAAVDAFAMDARADDLPRYVRNLHQIERDGFLLPETPIALPRWIDEDG